MSLTVVGVALSQSGGPVRNPSPLLLLTQSSTPCTVQEELIIARYLQRQTESCQRVAERLDLTTLAETLEIDEETAEMLEIRIGNLQATLKEMSETLKLIERSIQEFPAEYAQTAALLWLTVIKDIATEKENAHDLRRLELVECDWPNIADLALPKLFSRIVEPRVTEVLRVLRNEHLVPPSR